MKSNREKLITLMEALDSVYSDSNEFDPTDVIEINVPTLIRLFEYINENDLDDVKLHTMTEKMLEIEGTITMDHYDHIVNNDIDENGIIRGVSAVHNKSLDKKEKDISQRIKDLQGTLGKTKATGKNTLSWFAPKKD